MNNLRSRWIVILGVLLCLVACDPDSQGHYDQRLKIINDSSEDVYSFINTNYPDSTMGLLGGCISCIVDVKANSSKHLSNSHNWEKYIEDRNDMNVLSIFIVSRDTFVNIGTPGLQNSTNYLERYDLSVEELKAANWEVYYP